MSRGTEVIAALKELHPDRDIDICLATYKNASDFVVLEDTNNVACIEFIDDSVPIFIDDSVPIDGFKVSNLKHRNINLLATDHCFFADDDRIKKCDFVLFDDIYFCFVELKLNVTRKPSDKIHEAQEQLGTTIDFLRNSFSQKSKRFFNFELEAYVVMQSRIYPKHPAGKAHRRVSFKDKYQVKFFEQNSKTFDR
jgi:hypothetical protein